MDLLKYYFQIAQEYPEHVSQQDCAKICKLSKKATYLLEKNGAIPFNKQVNQLMHTHSIKLVDVLAIKYEREFGYLNNSEYQTAMRYYYIEKLDKHPDVLLISDIVEITGFGKKSIHQWISKGYIKVFSKRNRYHVPKSFLIDFLISPTYNSIQKKSKKQIEHLTRFSELYVQSLDE